MHSNLFRSLALAACALTIGASAQQTYAVLDHWKIGGVGGWDYLLADPGAHRLYVTHGPRVEVLDTDSGKAVGAITGLKGTHGVALDPEGRFGYISDGGANAVVVFDRKTLATVATVPVGTNPDGIAYEPTTKTVWAFNGRSKNVSVVDTASRTVMATIALPGKPEFPQVDGKGHVFVNIEDKNSILRLGAASKTVTDTWPLVGCESPSGMAIDREHSRLFSVCDGKKMAVVNAETGKVLALPTIGEGPDAAGYDDKAQLAFSPNGEGTLTVIDARAGYKVLQQLPTMKGGRTMSYDAGKDRVYVVTAEFGPAPQPSATAPRPRPAVLPDTFQILVIGRK
ncbi:MAG: beta-propeller fold lactonase family protein [Janthinobacterium lividum]